MGGELRHERKSDMHLVPKLPLGNLRFGAKLCFATYKDDSGSLGSYSEFMYNSVYFLQNIVYKYLIMWKKHAKG